MFGFKTFRLARVVSDLEERLARLERSQKAVEMEWDQAWEKLKRMMGRISKRSELSESAPEPETPVMGGQGNGAEPISTGRLSDRQKAIQQQIMRRRAGG